MRSFVAGIALVVVLLAAGCGGGSSNNTTNGSGNGEASKSAQQVLTDTVNAAKAANTMHMSGQVTSNGKQIDIDLSVVKSKGATGTLSLDGHSVDLVVIGTDAYMKADADFYSQFGGSMGSSVASLLAGKWLKFSTTNPQFGGFTAFADSTSLFDSMTSNHGKLANKGETTYKGQDVVNIADSAENGSLYVSATGTPYPVALVKSGTGGGTITFDKWNDSVSLTAPSGAVDLSHFTG